MNQPVIWIHGDCLNPHQTALQEHPGVPALFVWDDVLIQKRQLSFKRILFIYECLLELPVTIRRGHIAEELAAFAREHGTSIIVTTISTSPGFRRICRKLRQNDLQLVVYDEAPFVELVAPDLGRFSRYWRAAQFALYRSQT